MGVAVVADLVTVAGDLARDVLFAFDVLSDEVEGGFDVFGVEGVSDFAANVLWGRRRR